MPGGNLMLLDVLRASLAAVACGGGAVEKDIVARAAEVVRLLLADGAASLSSVAERLHMPARTLQRRLADQGLSFSQLIEDVRKRLARTYLQQPEIPLTEIALLLGYSESSAFSRAFRQWYGVSPSRFR
jgi:AraC-like DNA-binding protein